MSDNEENDDNSVGPVSSAMRAALDAAGGFKGLTAGFAGSVPAGALAGSRVFTELSGSAQSAWAAVTRGAFESIHANMSTAARELLNSGFPHGAGTSARSLMAEFAEQQMSVGAALDIAKDFKALARLGTAGGGRSVIAELAQQQFSARAALDIAKDFKALARLGTAGGGRSVIAELAQQQFSARAALDTAGIARSLAGESFGKSFKGLAGLGSAGGGRSVIAELAQQQFSARAALDTAGIARSLAGESFGKSFKGLAGLGSAGGGRSVIAELAQQQFSARAALDTAAIARSLAYDAVRPAMVVETIAETLRSWWPMADRGLGAAQVALRAALNTVAALERHDVDARHIVKQFLLDWLGFRHVSWDLVCSAALVLLDKNRWLPTEFLSLGTFDPRGRLRRLTLVEHRHAKRLSTDPSLRFRGRPLRSLDEPVRLSDGEDTTLTLHDFRPDDAAPEPFDGLDTAEITDPRLLKVWWKFNDREREILREKGRPRMTWPAAAVACGGTVAEGERLRRKVKRLSKAASTGEPPIEAVG